MKALYSSRKWLLACWRDHYRVADSVRKGHIVQLFPFPRTSQMFVHHEFHSTNSFSVPIWLQEYFSLKGEIYIYIHTAGVKGEHFLPFGLPPAILEGMNGVELLAQHNSKVNPVGLTLEQW